MPAMSRRSRSDSRHYINLSQPHGADFASRCHVHAHRPESAEGCRGHHRLIVTIAVPAAWSSAIVMSSDFDQFVQKPERTIINGGYFDAQGQPGGLLFNGVVQTGRLRHDKP
jgi:hypothetical protein